MATTTTDIPSIIHPGAPPELAFRQKLGYFAVRTWIVPLTLVLGLYVGLPFLAPLFMHWGWTGPAKTIYLIYSGLCHQLPQRSYFLFGRQFTYSLVEIQNAWQNTLNPMVLRQFIGNAEMGWKVAWSDRMVSMFTSTLVFGLLWWRLRRRIPRLPWWGLILFLLPMALDGTTHLIGDLAGIGQGFRDTNTWLVVLTNHVFPQSFYAGDAWGSFNSLMRLITGLLFGVGVVWFGYPYLDDSMVGYSRILEQKFQWKNRYDQLLPFE